MPIESTRQRQRRIRAERQQLIDEQVATGRLVIRQATEEERERYGIRPEGDEGADRGPE